MHRCLPLDRRAHASRWRERADQLRALILLDRPWRSLHYLARYAVERLLDPWARWLAPGSRAPAPGSAADRYLVLRGGSMYPTLRDRELLLLEPLCAGAPVRGDIVVFRSPRTGVLVVHRVLALLPAGLLTRGDNNDREDAAPVAAERVSARVAAVCRSGRFRWCPGGWLGVLHGACMRSRNALARATVRRWAGAADVRSRHALEASRADL